MIKIYIAKYKAKYCYEDCFDFYKSLFEDGVPVDYYKHRNRVVICGFIEVNFIHYREENLKGLSCDCIVGVSEHEKFKAEYGSKYKHLFKNVDSETRLRYTLASLIKGVMSHE